MIFTIADIIVCGLGVVLGTIFEYWQAGKLERQSGLMVKKKITFVYMLVALVVCILRMVIEMKLAGSEPNWKLYATCVLQGSGCGVYISMVMLFYIGSKYEEKTKGGKGIPESHSQKESE